MKDYWSIITERLKLFWQPGDRIECGSIYSQQDGTCELCDKFPITWHHVLLNRRTWQTMTVGSECVHNYEEGIRRLGFTDRIRFPQRYVKAAQHFNDRHPGAVIILDADEEAELREYEEMVSQGLIGPPDAPNYDEIDWDEYELE